MCSKSNFNFFKKLFGNKKIVILPLLLLLIIIYTVPSIFAAPQPVKSVEFFSNELNYQNKDPGAWKITKSARWVRQGEVEVTLNVESILKTTEELKDVLFVLDVSGSMSGEKLTKVKSDATELVESLLSNGKNRAGLISFGSTSELLTNLTTDKNLLIKKINDLELSGCTNYYQALINIDNVLKNYKSETGREFMVLFLTDGYPNEDTPNEVGQYQYLKNQYPFLNINVIQYEMGSEVLEQVKKISDNQFIADIKTLNNVLFDASLNTVEYSEFKISDYINTNHFTITDKNNIKVSQGKASFDELKQMLNWDINNYNSGRKATMKFNVRVKSNLPATATVLSIGSKSEITSRIDDDEEYIISTRTPALAMNYSVTYDGNAPDGCSVSNVPANKRYAVYETVEISDNEPKCSGYYFKEWDISTKGVVKANDDYFVMPGEDVVLKAKWSKMTVKKTMDGEIYVSQPPVLQKVSLSSKLWKYKDSITKAIMETQINIPASAIEYWDVSDNGSGSVMAYIVPNESDSSTYTAHIQGTDTIIANPISSYLFSNFTKLEEIIGLENLDTSQVTSMYKMFYECAKLKKINLSNFDTSNVTNMGYIFRGCKLLTSIDVSNFNTSKVTDMSDMFFDCSGLTSLDVSNFDTSNVTDMSGMFFGCSGLTSLDVSNFDTSQVTYMSFMFCNCISLTNLDVSKLATLKATKMSDMFSNCRNLTSLDVSNFDTSQVTGMSDMFSGCSGLVNLNIGNFNTSKVTDMSGIFKGCKSLTRLDLSKFDTSKVIDMNNMFSNCESLTSLNISNFDTSQVTDMKEMFQNCKALSSLNVSNFNTPKVTNMESMFYHCESLTSIDIRNFDTSNVTVMRSMFCFCRCLTSLDLINFDVSNVVNMSSMFYCCESLTSLDLSKFDTSKVTEIRMMFYHCESLTVLDLSKFDTSKVTDMSSMFYHCESLTVLDLSNFDTSKVTDMSSMFSNCRSLKSLDLSKFDTSKVTYMSFMFSNSINLSSLDLSKFDTSNVTEMNMMFFGCSTLSTTISITNPNVSKYNDMFGSAADEGGAKIIVNYTTETSNLVDLMIATKSSYSNVVKGGKILEYSITVSGNSDIVANLESSCANKLVELNSVSGNFIVISFKMNGTLITGNSFKMPASNVIITDIVTVEMVTEIIESEHNPYPNGLNNKVYGEKTFSGATSLTVVLDYQTESTSFDWIYLYDSTGKEYGKYGGKTRKAETITIPGDYVKIVFRTDSSGNSYYGFKASIRPNYN